MTQPTLDEMAAAYALHGSVQKAGRALGISPQWLHTRLHRIGGTNTIRKFTEAEAMRLTHEYHLFRNVGRLKELASSMGRTVPFLCRQARSLGLTDRNHQRPWGAKWKYLTIEATTVIWDEFKASRLGLGAYCKMKGYDDLGFSRTMKAAFEDEYEHTIESKAPRQSMYRIGRALEYRTRDLLKTFGYFVMRSPASKSPIDLVAIRKGEVLFIQSKRGGAMTRNEWNDLFSLCTSVGAVPLMSALGIGGRGIYFKRLTGLKDGTKKPQPWVDWEIPNAL